MRKQFAMTIEDLQKKGYVRDANGCWYKPQREWSAAFREKCIDELCKPQNQHLLGIGPCKKTWPKCGWRMIGRRKFFFRSMWEANYARYLDWLKARGELREWDYESETFWFKGIKQGVVSYKPDFRVTTKDGNVEYHEVKGYLDKKSKTKHKRMAIFHPEVTLKIIGQSWMVKNAKNLKNLVPGWELSG